MKKIEPHSSSAFSYLVTLALNICRFVHLLAEAEIALLMRNQTQAPAAECAPFHGGTPLDFTANREYGDLPFHFANGRRHPAGAARGRA
jgi:hypothetical protein